MSDEDQAVIHTVEAMTRAFHEGDLEGVMARYEPSAVIVFERGSPVRDREAQRQHFSQIFRLAPRFSYAAHEVVVCGDLATHFAPWTMTAMTPDGQQIEDRGLSVAVLRKQPDGAWLIVTDAPHGDHLVEKPAPASRSGQALLGCER